MNSIDFSKLYTLHSIEQEFCIKKDEFLKKAAKHAAKICVLLPKDHVVMSVDVTSIDCGEEENLKRKCNNKYTPPSSSILPQTALEKIVALVVSVDVIRHLERNWTFNTEQKFFEEAYCLSNQTVLFGGFKGRNSDAQLELVQPKLTVSLYEKEKMYKFDMTNMKFAIYPQNIGLDFIDDVGYSAPFVMTIKFDELRILGSELHRLLNSDKNKKAALDGFSSDDIQDNDIESGELEAEVDNFSSPNQVNIREPMTLDGMKDLRIKLRRVNFLRDETIAAMEALIQEGKEVNTKAIWQYFIKIADTDGSSIIKKDKDSIAYKNMYGKIDEIKYKSICGRFERLYKEYYS